MKKKSKINKIKLKMWIPFFLMGLPGMVYLFINNYMPLYGLQIAFKDYNYAKGIWGSAWVGLKNFEFMFKSNDVWIITRNTVLYNAAFIILNMVLGIAIALFLNEIRKGYAKKIYQSLVLLPYLISMVIVSYLVYAFAGNQTGLINTMLSYIGLQPIEFYMEKKWWPFILIFVYEWRNIGYGAVIYLASLVGIDISYYESAVLDGASKWQEIKYITLPLLKPTIIMMTTIAIGQIFRSDFALFYQVPRNQGLLYDVTDTIDTYVFRALMQNGNIALSSAAAFYQSVVCFIMVMTFNGVMRKVSREDAIM